MQFHGKSLQIAGKNLKGQEINLQILGDGLIFLGMIRKFEIRVADFREYPLGIPDSRMAEALTPNPSPASGEGL